LVHIIEKLNEIEHGSVGLKVYSTRERDIKLSLNEDLVLPLASAAKVAIGFSLARWVENGEVEWKTQVKGVTFNPEEDSKVLYPHFQDRTSLSLGEAVEVMIACHDSYVASSILKNFGSWKKVNQTIQNHFPTIQVTENPRDVENKGQLEDALDLMVHIFKGYHNNPIVWTPIINGLIRQQGAFPNIPEHQLNHMTGGLAEIAVDLGILGDFNEDPFIFVLGAKGLPDRSQHGETDQILIESMEMLYHQCMGRDEKDDGKLVY